MKYHCPKCGLHFDYPKKANDGSPLCPSCKEPAVLNIPEEDATTPTAGGSPWRTVAVVILVADIIGSVIACLSMCRDGIKWAFVGGALAEVAFVALLCGTVYLLASIDTTLKVIGIFLAKK